MPASGAPDPGGAVADRGGKGADRGGEGAAGVEALLDRLSRAAGEVATELEATRRRAVEAEEACRAMAEGFGEQPGADGAPADAAEGGAASGAAEGAAPPDAAAQLTKLAVENQRLRERLTRAAEKAGRLRDRLAHVEDQL